MARKLNEYVVYDRKTEEIIVIGTAEECAKKLGIKECSFRNHISKQKNQNFNYIVVKLED